MEIKDLNSTRLEQLLSRPDTADRMKFIETQVAKAVVPYRENTEAAIVIFALLRVTRTLLSLYPPHVQQLLLSEVLVPFLQQDAKADGLLIKQ